MCTYRRRSRTTSLLIALCAAGLSLTGLPPAPSVADPKDDARSASRAADRAEAVLENATVTARNAARRLEAATAAIPAAQHRVGTSRGIVAATRVEANTARRRADAARAAYDRIADDFEEAQGRVRAARQRVDDIASASYMGANFAALNVLVSATGPQDAMDRLDLVGQVMQKGQDGVAEMTAARRAVRIQQDRAGLARRAAEKAEQDAVDKLAAAKNAQDAAEQAQIAVIRLAQTRRHALAVARSQRAAVLARYRRAAAEERRVRAALATWEVRSGGSVTSSASGSGRLLMPVRGWKTSDFGNRYDPYYHVWQLHAGTDFAAGGGTPIRAAADGHVIRAGWGGGYGNYTCLGHGDGLSTCYGHQSSIGVHVGEYVRRGEVIGRVGTTGASTGYHLHFETRVNGVPRNPLGYLPACLC